MLCEIEVIHESYIKNKFVHQFKFFFDNLGLQSTQKSRKKLRKVSQNVYLAYFFTCFFEKVFYSFSCVPKKSAHAPPLG